ncbi:hypothetical protein FALBO_11717 [Fusarium albosuccineum]|uniref:Uncharacterized protein n=1 Tax=Fusarium albosuccineum TaxID=1237068 RepID=A0A8H4P6Y3_9HYPO|nr:hypothetical protein FALBO_11717 [Fusarium albosuccineum]
MRFTYAAALLAGNALAITHKECLQRFNVELASDTDCADPATLRFCLSHLEKFDQEDVKECYVSTGCSFEEAEVESHHTWQRCDELARAGDLRKRYQAAPLPTFMPRADAAPEPTEPPHHGLFKRADTSSGTDCFTTGETETESCPLTTKDGKTQTKTCFNTKVTTSKCSDDVICTLDSNNNDICMVKQEMGTAGIIIAICFAAALALMMGYLTFMCCRDKKEQKRLAAKAETVALARAATKKQRAAQRQPLIRNASGQSNPGSNPFQDGNRV